MTRAKLALPPPVRRVISSASSSEGTAMAVRIEKKGKVWTVIHDRPEARNAMDPESADRLTAAFLEFDADKDAAVAVFYGAGGGLMPGGAGHGGGGRRGA